MSEEKRWDNTWDTPEQNVYKEETYQSQGEYHENTQVNTTEAWQTGQQENYQQNGYQQNDYWQQARQNMYQEPERKPSQAFGIVSLIFGILSLLCFYTCCNVLFAVIAIIFGIIQLTQNNRGKGMAIAGIITSVLSIVLLIAFYALFMFSVDFQNAFTDEFLEKGMDPDLYQYYEQYNDLLPDDYDMEENFDFDGDDTF